MEQSPKVVDVQLPTNEKRGLKWKIKLGLPKPLKVLLVVVFILLFIGAASGLVWSYLSYQKAQEQIVNLTSFEGRQEFDKQIISKLLEQVRKHIVLPSGEKPVVATITNVEDLVKNQPFFKGAHNGDSVIVYSKAKTAIIYDPNRDVIVKVGTVMVGNTQESSSPQTAGEKTSKDEPATEEQTTEEEESTTEEEPAEEQPAP